MTAMTVREFSFATPAELGRLAYLGVCERARLDPVPDGYGFLHLEDDSGEHWTAVTTDLPYLRRLVATSPRLVAGLELGAQFPLRRAGWPDEWKPPGEG
jgi:hypothetical protein